VQLHALSSNFFRNLDFRRAIEPRHELTMLRIDGIDFPRVPSFNGILNISIEDISVSKKLCALKQNYLTYSFDRKLFQKKKKKKKNF
jgi:hypothetical protein